jgi:uncharacterized membrane protein
VIQAQNPDRRSLGDRLERLNRKLLEIRSLALRYQSDEAIQLIQQAFISYNGAVADLQATPPRLVRARGASLKANQLANQAAKIILYKPAFRYRSELENMVRKAELAVHRNTNNEDGRYFVNKARAFQNQANVALQQGEFLRAQEYYRIAMYFAEKAFNVTEGMQQGMERESFQDQVRNMRSLLTNLGSGGEINPMVAEMVDKVEYYLDRAWQLYEQNNTAQAQVQLRISERFLYRAVDLQRSSGTGTKDQLREDLYSLRRYIDAVENSLEEGEPGNQDRFLQKARQFYSEAEQAVNRNQPETARQKINLSQRMAARAMQSGTRVPRRSEENLQRRLVEIEKLLELQRQKLQGEAYAGIELLHEEASALLSAAGRDLEQGNSLQAYQKIQLCLRLVNRIERMLALEPGQTADREEIRMNMDRLSGTLSRLLDNPDLESGAVERLMLLEKLLSRARQLFDTGRYEYAAELLKLIQNQIDNLLNESLR